MAPPTGEYTVWRELCWNLSNICNTGDFIITGSSGTRMRKTVSILKRCVKDDLERSKAWMFRKYAKCHNHTVTLLSISFTIIPEKNTITMQSQKLWFTVFVWTLKRASHLAVEATNWTCTTLQTQAGLKKNLHHWWFSSTVVHGALEKEPVTVCWPDDWLKNWAQLSSALITAPIQR